MPSQGEAVRKSSWEDDNVELWRLREAAKIASIYHRQQQAFRRSTKLSHVAHASLHLAQFVVASVIELFHYIHHRINELDREDDPSIPALPEERNPIFFIYPICMVISATLAILWLCKAIIVNAPWICLFGCFASAILMLLAGIMEMKHVNKYIDLAQITDEQLIKHPVFIHNFVMCILSMVCMTFYLVQGWILHDQVQWLTTGKSRGLVVSEGVQTEKSVAIGKHGDTGGKEKKLEEPGELRPIAALESFPTRKRVSQAIAMEDEPVVLYCCLVDCCQYLTKQWEPSTPVHEFQVVHVM